MVAGGLALWATLKANAIHAVAKKATDTVSDRFWGWLRKKLALDHAQRANDERTYKGAFQDYWYSSLPHPMHFFRITRDGFTSTVPVWDTAAFVGLKKGTLIEVDTEALPGNTSELVKRLRVQEPHA